MGYGFSKEILNKNIEEKSIIVSKNELKQKIINILKIIFPKELVDIIESYNYYFMGIIESCNKYEHIKDCYLFLNDTKIISQQNGTTNLNIFNIETGIYEHKILTNNMHSVTSLFFEHHNISYCLISDIFGLFYLFNLNTNKIDINFIGDHGVIRSTDTFILNNKRYIISGSDNGTLKIWDLNTEYCLKTLCRQLYNIIYIKVYYMNNLIPYVMSISLDKRIQIWNLENQICTNIIKYDIKPEYQIRTNIIKYDIIPEYITCAILKPGLKYLIVGSNNGKIIIYNLKTKSTGIFIGHTESVNCLTLRFNYELISGSNNCIKIWDLNTRSCKYTLPINDSPIKYINILPNQNIIAYTYSGQIIVYH